MAIPIFITVLVSYFVYQRGEDFLAVLAAGEMSFRIVILMLAAFIVLGIGYTVLPLKIIFDPLLKYRFNEEGLFYNKFGKEVRIQAGTVTEMHFPPKLQRDIGAIGSVWLRVNDTWHKVPTGYELSSHEWKNFERIMLRK